jgi:hypothetical protein
LIDSKSGFDTVNVGSGGGGVDLYWEWLSFFFWMIIPLVFYFIALQTALERCSESNRTMAPGYVWLLFIPLFNVVWHFVVALGVAKSLGKENRAKGISGPEKPSWPIGLALSFCIVLVAVMTLVVLGLEIAAANYYDPLAEAARAIFWCSFVVALAILVLWIVYWVKVHALSSALVPRYQYVPVAPPAYGYGPVAPGQAVSAPQGYSMPYGYGPPVAAPGVAWAAPGAPLGCAPAPAAYGPASGMTAYGGSAAAGGPAPFAGVAYSGALYCTKCGRPLAGGPFCPNCGIDQRPSPEGDNEARVSEG